MGLTYPVGVELVDDFDDMPIRRGNAALRPAVTACRAALLAGARTAAAEEAVRRLEREIALTRRRIRALDKRWLPWLHTALHERELTLEQAEQEDGVRLRRALSSNADGASS